MRQLISSQAQRSKAIFDAPLMTKAMRDRETEARKKKYPKTMIRVRFPNRITLQASFLSDEPGTYSIIQEIIYIFLIFFFFAVSVLYDVVRSGLQSPSTTFSLYQTPPMRILSDMTKSFWDYELAPATMLYFRSSSTNDVSEFWNDDFLSKLEDWPFSNNSNVAPDPSTTSLDAVHDSSSSSSSSSSSTSSSSSSNINNSDVPSIDKDKNGAKDKVPKWLKIGRK